MEGVRDPICCALREALEERAKGLNVRGVGDIEDRSATCAAASWMGPGRCREELEKERGTLENPLWGMIQEVYDDLQVREWCGWSLLCVQLIGL